MNTVGKIFIVLTTAMSFIFMSFALAAYATHRNWKLAIENAEATSTQPLGWKPRLEQEKKKLADLQAEHDKLKKDVAEEKQAQRQVLAKLEAQRDELIVKRDDLQKERDALNLKDQESVAALATSQNALQKLTKEVEGLRKEIRLVQKERDDQFKQVVATTDNIHQVTLELKVSKDRLQQVSAQYAKLKEIAELKNWSPIEQINDLHGKIVGVSAENLVEVSIGSHDGLKVGNTLEVFRGAKYLGRVEVVRLDTNRAVAKILPDFKQGQMQKGDDVASRLKLS